IARVVSFFALMDSMGSMTTPICKVIRNLAMAFSGSALLGSLSPGESEPPTRRITDSEDPISAKPLNSSAYFPRFYRNSL
ncbi:MAG: hypothetical protein VXZ01_07115, partial [Pseudomonadota bacterium]|nr:hypothetical protein [Pseudomonadota bacterium]